MWVGSVIIFDKPSFEVRSWSWDTSKLVLTIFHHCFDFALKLLIITVRNRLQLMMMMMMMMMMNCFCGLVDRRKTFSLISSQAHRQRSSPLRISDTPRVGFEPTQNLSSGLVEWSCAVNLQFTLWIMIWKVISFKYLIFATYCGTRCYALWPDGVPIN